MSLTLAILGFASFAGMSAGTIYVLLRESRGAFPLREEVVRKHGYWHWRILDRHGDVVAEGQEPYLQAHEARKAVRLVAVAGLAE